MDREKVIKGLECCSTPKQENCNCCPYRYPLYPNGDRDVWLASCQQLYADALELLKEQEAVEPTLIREGRNKNYNDYVCPRCDNEVVYEQNYCSECGAQFLWEGR